MAKVKTTDEVRGETVQQEFPYLDKDGREVLDPVPMAPPVGYVKQPSMMEVIRQQIHMSKLAALDDLQETLEEADDFETDEDRDDPTMKGTQWENDRDPSIKELVKEGKIALDRKSSEARRRSQSGKEARDSVRSPKTPPAPSQDPETPPDGGDDLE